MHLFSPLYRTSVASGFFTRCYKNAIASVFRQLITREIDVDYEDEEVDEVDEDAA